MNDDFLHRIRAAPSPRFLFSLHARLLQLDREVPRRRPIWQRGFFWGGLTSAVVFASGLFIVRATHDASPSILPPNPSPSASSRTVDYSSRVALPPPTDATPSNDAVTSTDKATSRAPGQLVIGAPASFYPIMKSVTRFSFPEPALSEMSPGAAIAALCSNGMADIVVVNRRILPDELDACRRLNKHIAEVKLGYEAIVLARSKLYETLKLDARSIFLALAREIPDPLHPGNLVRNPNLTWDQVDPSLPDERIDVSGPSLSSPTGAAFRDLVLKPGCLAIPTIAALKQTEPARFENVCGQIRTDGVYRVGEVLSQRVGDRPFDFAGYFQTNPEAIALLGYREGLHDLGFAASSLDGIAPSHSTISSGSYPGARVLYLYSNTEIPAARNFVFTLWSSVTHAPGDTAFVPPDAAELRALRQQVLALPNLNDATGNNSP